MPCLIAKKVVITIGGPFGLIDVSKQAVLDALAIDLVSPNGVTSYQRDTKVEIQITTEDDVVVNLSTTDAKTLFDQLLIWIKDAVAQNILPDFEGDRPLTKEELNKLRLLTERELFEAWCTWNGLINYAD